MRINPWRIAATLCLVAALGFVVAYLIGESAPYLAIAAMWIGLGCLNLVVGARRNKPKSEKFDRENQRKE
ncbi:hypothetical protein EG834_17845 [bacterium]|nr:hypothetical protein [bacterium]